MTSASMRTAGRMPPSTETWPTPVTVLRRWPISVSARSLRSRIETDIRRERERDDGGVGRIDLRVGRRIGQVARQRRAGGVDRRLHVLGGGVDVAAEVELHRDLAEAVSARRGHGRERRDLPELALERGGHQRRHRLRVGAGKLRRHLDGRKVHLRKRGHRQTEVAERAAENGGKSKQRCRDRPLDEGAGDAHGTLMAWCWARLRACCREQRSRPFSVRGACRRRACAGLGHSCSRPAAAPLRERWRRYRSPA